MSSREFWENLRRAVDLDHPYSLRYRRDTARLAAVLILIAAPEPGAPPSVLLTQRTDRVETHKGQIAFPGGMLDETDEGLLGAALRETEEEVGISRASLEVAGKLPDLWTITGFQVTPFVGWSKLPIAEIQLKLNEAEIEKAFWVPLEKLREIQSTESIAVGPVDGLAGGSAGGVKYITDVYQVGPHRVWGATAAMIRNLLERLDQIG